MSTGVLDDLLAAEENNAKSFEARYPGLYEALAAACSLWLDLIQSLTLRPEDHGVRGQKNLSYAVVVLLSRCIRTLTVASTLAIRVHGLEAFTQCRTALESVGRLRRLCHNPALVSVWWKKPDEIKPFRSEESLSPSSKKIDRELARYFGNCSKWAVHATRQSASWGVKMKRRPDGGTTIDIPFFDIWPSPAIHGYGFYVLDVSRVCFEGVLDVLSNSWLSCDFGLAVEAFRQSVIRQHTVYKALEAAESSETAGA